MYGNFVDTGRLLKMTENYRDMVEQVKGELGKRETVVV